MKNFSSALLLVTIFGSTAHAQQSRSYPERSYFPSFEKRSKTSLAQFKVKTPCRRNTLAFRLKGVFKIKREYMSPQDFKSAKYFTVNIHPYRIHVKPKTKSL